MSGDGTGAWNKIINPHEVVRDAVIDALTGDRNGVAYAITKTGMPVNSQDGTGDTVLHGAVSGLNGSIDKEHVTIVKFALGQGARTDIANKGGETQLDAALKKWATTDTMFEGPSSEALKLIIKATLGEPTKYDKTHLEKARKAQNRMGEANMRRTELMGSMTIGNGMMSPVLHAGPANVQQRAQPQRDAGRRIPGTA
ncbi:MAG: hypothetical protein ABIF01_01955 [Candidatus Micrarchaeota archaeon]